MGRAPKQGTTLGWTWYTRSKGHQGSAEKYPKAIDQERGFKEEKNTQSPKEVLKIFMYLLTKLELYSLMPWNHNVLRSREDFDLLEI